MRCMKCGERNTIDRPLKIGGYIYDTKGMFKGYVCEFCASKPPRYKKGICLPKWSCDRGKP